MLLGLDIFNSFVTWEVYLVGVSLVPLDLLIIVTGEGYLVVLSLVIPLGYLLEYTNPGADLPSTLMGAPLRLWFGSEAVRCLCCFRRLMDFHEANLWGKYLFRPYL